MVLLAIFLEKTVKKKIAHLSTHIMLALAYTERGINKAIEMDSALLWRHLDIEEETLDEGGSDRTIAKLVYITGSLDCGQHVRSNVWMHKFPKGGWGSHHMELEWSEKIKFPRAPNKRIFCWPNGTDDTFAHLVA